MTDLADIAVEGNPTPEINQLYKQVMRSPYQGLQTSGITNEMGQDLWDKLGGPDLFARIDGLLDFANSNFENGPPLTSGLDAVFNPLPDWLYGEGTGTWSSTHGGAPDGYFGVGIEFLGSGGAGGETAWVEQDTAVFKYRPFVVSVGHDGSNANMRLFITIDFLDSQNVSLSASTAYYDSTAATVSRYWRIPPDLAVTARVRVGASSLAGYAGSQDRTIWFVSKEQPYVYSQDISGVLSYTSPGISDTFSLPYPSDIIPGGVYKADTRGFVVGVGAKTNDTIAAGTATVRVNNETAATNPGPTVALSNGTLAGVATASLDDRSTYDFAPGDELHLEMVTDGSYSSTGLADYFGQARLLLVVNDETDW